MTESTSDLLAALVAAYGLPGELEDIEVITPRGYPIYLFSVAGNRYVVKPGYDNWPESDIRFKFGLQRYLHEAGYPIPAVYRTKDEQVIWQHAGTGYVLFDYVGVHYDPALHQPQCDASALALGQFHRLAPTAPNLGTCYWEDADPTFGYSQAFLDNARGYAESRQFPLAKYQQVTACIDQMNNTLRLARDYLLDRDWFSLPHVPIHGEFCQYHCRYAGERVLGVIDWDTTRLAPRIQDAARALNVAIGWGPVDTYYSFAWQLTATPDLGAIARWVDHYLQDAPPFTQEELELFPYLCAAVWPTSGGAQVPRNEEEVNNCERVAEYMQFYLDEAEAIKLAIA